MNIAPIPDNETQRLEALQAYGVLDTEAEEEFNQLVLLAATICETPIALISLIDNKRQWFKASVGLETKETSRDIAFCSHAILQKDILEVEDTFLDKRFSDNPLVLDAPYIRFYAGAQLITPDGFPLGTLCTISDKPKRLNDMQRKALSILSTEVVTQLEKRKRLRYFQAQSDRKSALLQAINAAQHLFIEDTPTQTLFAELLGHLLSLTDSEYGFIGEVRYGETKLPYLKTRAITNIAWSPETQAFFSENAPKGLEFTNLKTLFGEVLTTQQAVISNTPNTDARSGGIPEGHPALTAFAGLPLFRGNRFIGMVGIANRPGGYQQDIIDFIDPLLATCAQLINAFLTRETKS